MRKAHSQQITDCDGYPLWSSYNNFALDKTTVVACPIQIDYVQLPLGYRA